MKKEYSHLDWISHPKEIIIELISELISNQSNFKQEEIEKLILGKLEINEEIAEKLNQLFGPSKDFWLNRQKFYNEKIK